MLSTSFKIDSDVFNYPIEWIPKRWNAIENYKEVWFGAHPFWIYYLNTILVASCTTALSCLFSSMAAYGFSKVNFPAGKWLFIIVLATYMVPQQSILVPQFIMYRALGLFDTRIGLILINSFSVLGTFMLRQFFMSVHNDFIESNRQLRLMRSSDLSGPGTITRTPSSSCVRMRCLRCKSRYRNSRP
jgi:multiple sugar transport system permease protein